MKVRIGGVQRSVSNPSDLRQIEQEIANRITQEAISDIVSITPRFLDRLEERVRVAATSEAMKIMSTIVDVIDRPQYTDSPGLSGADLTRGTELYAAGRVPWKPLNQRYARRKDRQARSWGMSAKAARARSSRMFFNRGTLRNYFKGQARSVIVTRMGGMQVDVDRKLPDMTYMAANNRLVRQSSQLVTSDDGDVAKIVLGRVTLTMFPRLSPAMLPMLATRQWTSAGDGAMEEAVFGNSKTAKKLLNRRDAYRALLTPVVQFFMLVRIPSMVNRSVRDYLRRTGQAYAD